MRPIPFPRLINWVQGEYNSEGSVFGIRKEKFFRPASRSIEIFGKKISTPIGPSSGPCTQLSQNILASFLAGGRYIELKTVQTMDGEELRKAISRPSIYAADEGYNVEWSTELTVEQALEEYIKAWFLCHVYAVEFNISEAANVIFNMSAGYSFDGIKSGKIDSFIEGMKNAGNTEIWQRCYDYIAANISSFSHFTKADLNAISPEVSNTITISTFYNCPSNEIEKIAAYFIGEKNLNTYIKCNPTLPGFETTRALLNVMGYDHVSFTDFHFRDDLQLNDAVKILRRLKALAGKAGLGVGVKLTNTLPVEIGRHELPGKVMYMSGRPLFPLSLYTAKKLSDIFHGDLPVSYSGGADFFNLKAILETGIKPVTMVTNMLKPGGTERLTQLAHLAVDVSPNGRSVNIKALNALCESAVLNNRYRKGRKLAVSRKISGALPVFDCAIAPCSQGCPLHIKIPGFLAAVGAEKYDEAFKIIFTDNIAPSITGRICDYNCQQKCIRLGYEDPLQIRTAELIAAGKAQDVFILSQTAPEIKTDESAAVIGAGPAGIAAAVFLRRNGVPVTVYEKRSRPFGAVQYAIPSFIISDEAISRDYQMAVNTGVQFIFNAPENYSIAELKKKHRFVVIATGAWKEGEAVVKKGQENIMDAMRFLEDSKKSNYTLNLGKKVAVIGGGDMAIACARAAKRNRGVDSVTIIYRRTREFMPALTEAQEQALEEKVIIWELLSPETWEDGVLTCEVTALGDYDDSGRRSFNGTGKNKEAYFNTVISAVSPKVDTEPFTNNHIHTEGLPAAKGSLESSVPGVYIAGSCRTGASRTAKAIADGKAAALEILRKLKTNADFPATDCTSSDAAQDVSADIYRKKGVISAAKNDNTDACRCLSCNVLCEICADVCPNRANVSLPPAASGDRRQIVHIDSMCNECGNCAVFCPYEGMPYRDKLTIFANEEDFTESENTGFLKTGETFKVRLENKSVVKYRPGGKNIPPQWADLLETILSKYEYFFNNEELGVRN